MHAVTDTALVYPAGHNIVIHNLETQQQQFIQLPAESEGITGLFITPNQRHVAVTERAEKATVTIYDLQTLKRRKVLSSVDISGKVRKPAICHQHCSPVSASICIPRSGKVYF